MNVVNDKILENFGVTLKDLRLNKNLSIQELSDSTKIDVGSLHKLEYGLIKKVNPLMLIKLADFYNINVLIFFTQLGYINNSQIYEYYNSTSEIETSLSIPLFNSINEIDKFNKKIDRKINLPFADSDSNLYYSFLWENDTVIIFKYVKTLKENELGIFKLGKEYIISKYIEKKGFVFFHNQINNSFYVEEKEKVSIIGKVIYKTEKYL